jgi:ABC-2 type transport system permease protein
MLFYKKILGNITAINGYFSAGIIIKKEMSKEISYKQATQNYSPIKSVSNSLFNISGRCAIYLILMLAVLIVQLVLLMRVGLINGTRNEDLTT